MQLNDYPEKLTTKIIKRALLCNSKSKSSQTRKHEKFLYHMKKE